MGIPNYVHFIWIGDRPFTHEAHLEEWRRLNPGYDIHLWTEENMPDLEVQPIVDQITYPAGKANLIRLELLARYGGVYADTDCWPQKPLDTLPIPDWATGWGMTSRHDFVQNALLAAELDHPVFGEFVDQAFDYWDRIQGEELVFTKVFGSHYITDPLRADPTFWEPDRGTGWKFRHHFRDREEGHPGEAWVVHECERSWKRDLGGSTVRL